MKVIWIAVMAAAALLALVLFLGWLAPVEHLAVTRARYHRHAPAEVWKRVGDLSTWPSWQRGITRAERQPDVNGHQIWKTDGRWGPSRWEVLRQEEPSRLVTRLVDTDKGFGGTWTWELQEVVSGTEVTLTERGVIWNPLFRFLGFHLFGYHTSQKAALRSLGRTLGEPVAPEVVS